MISVYTEVLRPATFRPYCCPSLAEGLVGDASTLNHCSKGAILHAQQVGNAVVLQPLAIMQHQHLHGPMQRVAKPQGLLLPVGRCHLKSRCHVTAACLPGAGWQHTPPSQLALASGDVNSLRMEGRVSRHTLEESMMVLRRWAMVMMVEPAKFWRMAF